MALLDTAIARNSAGPFQIKAAIATCHCHEPLADWPQIAALYGGLLRYEPTSVVALNRAVAVAEAGDLPSAMVEVAALAKALDDYQPYHAVHADLLARSGKSAESYAA